MEDRAILDCIHGFVAEEHRIRSLCERGELDPRIEAARLAELETGLDQMWALLRRRRALRAQGVDPDSLADGGDSYDGPLEGRRTALG
jgi:hypothetical protein